MHTNLWPEQGKNRRGVHAKDRVENALHRAVWDSTITLRQVQQEIAADWVAAYRRYVGPIQCNAGW